MIDTVFGKNVRCVY